MVTGQQEFFPEPPKEVVDSDAVAASIAANAPDNPYASQESRKLAIANNYAATYTPDTIPSQLADTLEIAEQRWRDSAPGAQAVAETTEIVPTTTTASAEAPVVPSRRLTIAQQNANEQGVFADHYDRKAFFQNRFPRQRKS
jgi:hypothetical protein